MDKLVSTLKISQNIVKITLNNAFTITKDETFHKKVNKLLYTL